MNRTTALGLDQVAARAALAVPGVIGLQPSLKHRLATAAQRLQPSADQLAQPAEAGIRARPDLHGSGWHLEVRCVLHESRRALDTAREVHRHVRTAVTTHLVRQHLPGPVTVQVTIVQTLGGPPR
ncbi:hypothetical protein ABT112_25060 [Streptomyces sp. NPDC002055]|uniref:hypothetical protein n=1 Tax=Streptomyces sp. NPDC002055 TaxID=3154534 RepID=UPI0033174C31